MDEFINLMEEIESPGTFSVGGVLASTQPGLKVKGVGNIALPLLEDQAKALIELSQQAPFGRGEETIVDTDIRNVWQISTEDFELTNPQWAVSLQESIDKMGQQLGLDGCKIDFEQYKLLVYEEGSFFTPHRDTEKIPNMFATLVISLPSEHEGGELIISHDEQSETYSFADADKFRPSFVAFYADCYHEVKPITSGYRICLIYNLAIANRKQQPVLSDLTQVVERVNSAIQEWASMERENPILVYLLEHSYSEKNLSLTNLKHGDFSRATVLLNAAAENDCQAHLCLATYYQTSYGEAGYYDRYSDDLDEDDFEEYDIDKEEVYAHSLITAQGIGADINRLALEEDEIIAKIPLSEGAGRGYSISEATGNAGATKELWYHRGAVIIWPTEHELDLIPRMGVSYGVDFLKKFLQENDLSAGNNRQKMIQLASYVVENQSFFGSKDISQELFLLDDIDLVKKSIHRQMKQYSFRYVNSLQFIQMAEHFGWQHFEKEVHPYLTPQRETLGWLLALLHTGEPISDEGRAIIAGWVGRLWKPLLALHSKTANITTLLQVVALLKMNAVADEIIAFLAPRKKALFFADTYGPAIVESSKLVRGHDYDRAILRRFAESVRQRIEADSPPLPEKPKDLARAGKLNCSCEFCTQVNEFLPDPEKSEIRTDKTLKRNLLHVESEIEKSQVDVSITINRTPPKFQGVFRKIHRSYDNQLKLFNSTQKILKDLGRLEKSHADS